MKPYQQMPIVECGEPLCPIPLDQFAIESPHPYVKLAAPYGQKSPYFLRRRVVDALLEAQRQLQQDHPGWRIQIFDAYRPIAVQQFMVDYTFAEALRSRGLIAEQLTDAQRQTVLEEVYQFWAVPSPNPLTPPPHSTGAALDITLVDAVGQVVDMGSPIDEMSPRSYPDYFASPDDERAGVEGEPLIDRVPFHRRRQILKNAMVTAGFRQHPNEWWHFSLGDQLWAWLMQQENPAAAVVARYGAV